LGERAGYAYLAPVQSNGAFFFVVCVPTRSMHSEAWEREPKSTLTSDRLQSEVASGRFLSLFRERKKASITAIGLTQVRVKNKNVV
jgi:hypothetical protein